MNVKVKPDAAKITENSEHRLAKHGQFVNKKVQKNGINRANLSIRTEQPPQTEKRRIRMDRYVCQICGYVYDPEQGDPDNGVAAGTKWEDVPDDWECPVCGASKDDFEKE